MISILCPTRNRPENIKRLFNSAVSTADEGIEFVFYIDEDDTKSESVLDNLPVKSIKGKRIVLSQMWNECADMASGDIMMHAGDDLVFKTTGWDTLVKEVFKQFPDGIAFVYGRDGYSPDDFGTHGFLHKNWVTATGYFVPPYFSSDYNDTWLNDVAKRIGRHVFLPDLLIEHMHPICGKGEWDRTHEERLERGRLDNVSQLYESLLDERIRDAEKLKRFMK